MPETWLFIGDSLTGAYPGYVDIVRDALDIRTMRRVAYHLGDAILSLPSGRYNAIVVELGIHVIVGCDHAPSHSPRVFHERYTELLNRLSAMADRLIVVNVPKMGGWDAADPVNGATALNDCIQQIADSRNIPVADAWSAMAEVQEGISEDGFHPNLKGHEAIAGSILDALRPKPKADHA